MRPLPESNPRVLETEPRSFSLTCWIFVRGFCPVRPTYWHHWMIFSTIMSWGRHWWCKRRRGSVRGIERGTGSILGRFSGAFEGYSWMHSIARSEQRCSETKRSGEGWEFLAFFPKKLNPAECKYNAFGHELLTIYLTVKIFSAYGRSTEANDIHEPQTAHIRPAKTKE